MTIVGSRKNFFPLTAIRPDLRLTPRALIEDRLSSRSAPGRDQIHSSRSDRSTLIPGCPVSAFPQRAEAMAGLAQNDKAALVIDH